MKTEYKVNDKVYIYDKHGLNVIKENNIGFIIKIETEYEDNGNHNSGDVTYYTITKVNGEEFYTKHSSDFTDLEWYLEYMKNESKEVIKRAEERKTFIDKNIEKFEIYLG